MALTFGGATSDRVTVSLPATPMPCTFLFWHYPTTQTSGRRLGGRSDFATYGNTINWDFTNNQKINSAIDFSGSIPANSIGAKTFSTNQWWFFAVVLNSSRQLQHYWGDLTTTAAEDTYTAQISATAGSPVDDSGKVWDIGNTNPNDGARTLAYQGRIAIFSRVDAALTLGQIQSWQFSPQVLANMNGFYRLGFAGTGTQPDWSGNGLAGTLSGPTVADDVPLMRPWRRPAIEVPYNVAAAAFYNPYYYREQIARAA